MLSALLDRIFSGSVIYDTGSCTRQGRKGRDKVTQRVETRAERENDRKQVAMFVARKIRCGRRPLMVVHAPG